MKFITKKRLKFFVFVVIIIALAVWLFSLELEGATREFVMDYGLIGLFILSFVGGINLIFPLPHIIFIPPLLAVGFNPFMLAVIAAVGTTLGDSVSYLLGKAGNEAFEENLSSFRRFTQRLFTRHPGLIALTLFFWAAMVPVPNEIWVVPAGISGYGVWKIIAIALLGNFVFNLLAIHLGSIYLM